MLYKKLVIVYAVLRKKEKYENIFLQMQCERRKLRKNCQNFFVEHKFF